MKIAKTRNTLVLLNIWSTLRSKILFTVCGTHKIIITRMIIPTILEGRFSELKHKVWFSSQFCTNYPAILTVHLLKKGRAFHTLEHKSMNHYIILFVALFLPIYSHEPVASTTSIDTLNWKANNIHFLWQYKFTVILLQIRLLVLDSTSILNILYQIINFVEKL